MSRYENHILLINAFYKATLTVNEKKLCFAFWDSKKLRGRKRGSRRRSVCWPVSNSDVNWRPREKVRKWSICFVYSVENVCLYVSSLSILQILKRNKMRRGGGRLCLCMCETTDKLSISDSFSFYLVLLFYFFLLLFIGDLWRPSVKVKWNKHECSCEYSLYFTRLSRRVRKTEGNMKKANSEKKMKMKKEEKTKTNMNWKQGSWK